MGSKVKVTESFSGCGIPVVEEHLVYVQLIIKFYVNPKASTRAS